MIKDNLYPICRFWPFSGIAAPVIYIVSDVVASLSYRGYSYVNQSVSELSAIGAPTALLWKILTLPFSPLIIAFGFGVAVMARRTRMRFTGWLLVLWGISGYAWLFFPMNVRGKVGSATDSGHLVLAVFTVLLLLTILVIGSGVLGKRFRAYSYISIAIMLIFGAAVGSQSPNVAAQLPTPFMGILERVSSFTPMVWMGVLAYSLLKTGPGYVKR